MGLWVGLKYPLDIMTITIAAIALGIAVDDTIHFMHRFDFQYKLSHGNYKVSINKAINTVGHPMSAYQQLLLLSDSQS